MSFNNPRITRGERCRVVGLSRRLRRARPALGVSTRQPLVPSTPRERWVAAWARCPRRSETHLTSLGSLPSAFLRVLQRAPLRRHTPRARSRGPKPASGRSLPGTVRVPSSRFLTALTACATRGLAGLLHPAADPGVHRVPDLRRACPRCLGSTSRCHALQSVPLPCSRTRRHRQAVPPRRQAGLATHPDLEALIRWGVRCGERRFRHDPPAALLGFPLEACRPTAARSGDVGSTSVQDPWRPTVPRRRSAAILVHPTPRRPCPRRAPRGAAMRKGRDGLPTCPRPSPRRPG
jgi:hypothetical protein